MKNRTTASRTGSLCTLLINCHGGRLCQVFRCSDSFMALHELDYRRIDLYQMPEQADLDRCRVFIYQHIGEKWGKMASDSILPRLPESCCVVRVPKLSCHIYWPFFYRPSCASLTWAKPCEQFPYFDAFLLECVARKMDPELAVIRYMALDLPKCSTSTNDLRTASPTCATRKTVE